MKNPINSRDWEALSGYLDGQLSDRERTRLETRLERDPELHTALEELRQTRGLLQNLPILRPPRNYTLTPEMVGLKRDIPRIEPVLRYVSILAMIILAFVAIGDFMTPGLPDSAPTVETAFNIYAPPAEFEQAVEIDEQAEPYPAGELALEAPAAEEMIEEAEGESRAPVMKAQVSTPTYSPTAVSLMPYPAMEEDLGSQEPIHADNLARESVIRIFEISLAIIAIGAGIAAFILRRGAVG